VAHRVSARLTARPAPRELRAFSLAVGSVFALIGALLAWRGRTSIGGIAAGLGALLVLAGAVAPGRLGPVHRAWIALALAISKVTTPLLMGIVYFGVLTPTGLVMRLFGRRVLVRPRSAATYWVDRPAGARRSDLRRQF
jgi:hypothetical protein